MKSRVAETASARARLDTTTNRADSSQGNPQQGGERSRVRHWVGGAADFQPNAIFPFV
jgi:hypothetical protein